MFFMHCILSHIFSCVVLFRYAKYFKMVAVGVPKQAIAGKMRMEGLDPAFLE